MRPRDILRGFSRARQKDLEFRTEPQEPKIVDRTLVLITHCSLRAMLLSSDLYEAVSGFAKEATPWVVESLAPLPLLSVGNEELSSKHAQSLFTWARDKDRGLRIVGAAGQVSYGLIGAGTRMGFGSSGDLVSSLVEAAVSLPRDYSWVDSGLAGLLGMEGGITQKVGELIFQAI